MKNRNFNILIIGQLISLFGSAIQRFSLSLYVLEITDSVGVFSFILGISVIPQIVLAPIAGIVSDRFDRRKLMIWLDVFSGVITLIYSLYLLKSPYDNNIVMVAVIMIILSCASTIYSPAVTASIPQIVKGDNLTRANGIVWQINSLSSFMGPIFAGFMYAFMDIGSIIFINAISFLFSAILEKFLNMKHKRMETGDAGIFKIVKGDLRDSYIYLKDSNPIVFRMILTSGLFNLFLVPISSVVTPYTIKIFLGINDALYGVSEGVIALGMILGGILITIFPKMIGIKKIHHILLVLCASIFAIGFVFVLPLDRHMLLFIYVVCSFIIMLVLGIANVVSVTFLQSETPEYMLGKISAFSIAFATMCVPIGQILFGQLINVASDYVHYIIIFNALMNFGVTMFVRWNVLQIRSAN